MGVPAWCLFGAVFFARVRAVSIRHPSTQRPEFQPLENFEPWSGPNRTCNISQTAVGGRSHGEFVFFIGLHKTGTNSYAALADKTKRRAFHGHEWMDDALDGGQQYISRYDAFADGGFHYLSDLDKFEFGHRASFDPRYLHACVPNASFVLNVRPLASWLVSKLDHWMRSVPHCMESWVGNMSDTFACEEKCSDAMISVLAQWIAYREYYHRRVMDLAGQNADFANRLLVTDLEVDGSAQTFCNLRHFLGGANASWASVNATCNGTKAQIHDNHYTMTRFDQQCVARALQVLGVDGSESISGEAWARLGGRGP